MWKPSFNFIGLHYIYILSCSLLAFPVFSPYGNVAAIDVLLFGCSGSTESGLNPVDVNQLKTYQQVFLYIIPMITNLGFINMAVVVVRLLWFRKWLKHHKPRRPSDRDGDAEDMEALTGLGNAAPASVGPKPPVDLVGPKSVEPRAVESTSNSNSNSNSSNSNPDRRRSSTDATDKGKEVAPEDSALAENSADRPLAHRVTTITFEPSAVPPRATGSEGATLRIPGPRESDRGQPITEVGSRKSIDLDDGDEDAIRPVRAIRRKSFTAEGLAMARSFEKAAASVLVLGKTKSYEKRPRRSSSVQAPKLAELPRLSQGVTVGRNSLFTNLTEMDMEILGGIEYRSLKLLLKITSSYFFGLHLFGIICLLPWIYGQAGTKYTNVLDQDGLGWAWWAFYSAQTMTDNLGLTLTPDSMISFRDATFPMLVMTFLAFAGNTFYPILLRLIIWTMSLVVPKNSQIKENLQFLLDHPRRCYTLLFPSKPTWVLFGVLFGLNFVDVILIVCLDLDNPSVADLAIGPRVLAALFQAASARHTGTSTFNLGQVNPAVQFSLVCMMYIAIYPIAISIRASNTYEDRALGVYPGQPEADELNGTSYVMAHVRNQLSFDLWYMFLGTFCICAAESKKIMDKTDPDFAVFPVFFEVVSAYGNVGLSLGHPSANTSFSAQFTTFSKFIICCMMIRGRHRGLPHSLDRAIMLPNETEAESLAEKSMSSSNGRTATSEKMFPGARLLLPGSRNGKVAVD